MDIENELFRIILGTVIPMVIAFMAGWIKSKVSEQRHERKEYEAIKNGLQDLLRDRLIQSYYHYEAKGWAPIYARENFARMYSSYKALDGNGVMEDISRKFKTLPTEEGEVQ